MANQRENYYKVSINNTVTVYPRAHPPLTHEERVIQLSNLDRQCPLLMYLIFFYRPPPPHHGLRLSEGDSLFSSLQRGLEETLSYWYPASGRLCPNPANGKLNLACTNSGALLIRAGTQAKISDLGDLSQYNEFYENLVFKPPFTGCISDMPLVVAQVTKFGCGGYALGLGTNHSLFDGSANYHFLSAWACRTVRSGDGEMKLVKPVHQRGRLVVETGRQRAVQVEPVMALDHLHQLIKQAASVEYSGPSEKLVGKDKFFEMGTPIRHEHYLLRTFPVSSSMVRRLRSNAATGCSSSSIFEVIAAHLWKARTKALAIPKDRMVCLQFAVDIRNKMHPPLPQAFSGNAFVLSSVSSTTAQLEQESLSTIVERIHKAKQAVNEDYVMRYLQALDHAPPSRLPPLPELTMVSDWTRTPYHGVDFGLGTALCASPLAAPFPQVAYFMQSPNDAEGVDVRIGLLEKHVIAFSRHFLDCL